MLLTPQQIAALRRILNDASTALAITTFGLDATPEQLQRLVDEGYIDEGQLLDLVRVAFTAGAEDGRQEVQQAFQFADKGRQLGFDDFLAKRLNQVPLSAPEKRAREIAATRAGMYCQGLGNRWSDQLQATIINADLDLANRTRGIIRDRTASAIEERKTRGQLRSDLRQATQDWSRDWERIANTEMQTAHQEGVFESVVERHGMDELLAKVPDPSACPACRSAYLENGKPKIRTASWWAEQGTNYGRKQKDWRPVIGSQHPNCLCMLVRVPAGWHFTSDWELVPPGGEDEEKSVGDGGLRKAGNAPAGFQPAPNSKHGGYRKKTADGWEYWYPEDVDKFHRHYDKKVVEREERLAEHRKLVKLGGEYDTGDGKYVVVLPDASEPGKVRTQTFSEDGFWGHRTYKDLDELTFDTLPFKGEWKPKPGILDKLSQTETWREGMARTLVVQVLNSLGYYRQKDDVERINKFVDKHGFRAAADALQGWSESSKQLSEKTRKLLSKAAGRWGSLRKAHKLHYRTVFAGLPISIENRKGSYRRWHDPDTGEDGKTFMSVPYGYVNLPSADAVDGDKLDVFLGPDQKTPMVYIVHQLKAPEFKTFDEFKCLIGFSSRSEAERAYLAHYDTPDFHGDITEVPIETFRENLLSGKYKGKRIAKAQGDVSGQAYDGRWPNTTVGSGGMMVSPEKTRRKVEHIIDMTSLMDWLTDWSRREKQAGRKRIIIKPEQFDSHLGAFSLPNPPSKDPPDPTMLAAQSENSKRNKQRMEDFLDDKLGVKVSMRELHRWHP